MNSARNKILIGFVAVVALGVFGFSVANNYPSTMSLAAIGHAVIGQNSTEILFVGDIMLDRYIRSVSSKKGEGFIFSCIDELLKGPDLVVGNLEGPITENPSRSVGTKIGSPENFVFTFAPTSAAALARHHIGLVNLGNNHIGNFGSKGIASTKKYLDAAGVGYFGGLMGDEPIYRTQNLSFISYNEFGGQSPAKVAALVASEKAAGQRVIVYTHWGIEYADTAEPLRKTAALFAAAGADAVIGSHPHVVLEHEYIGDTLVYYSLGNFIFDQYWDARVSSGLAVLLTITGDRVVAKEYPLTLGTDGRTCVSAVVS